MSCSTPLARLSDLNVHFATARVSGCLRAAAHDRDHRASGGGARERRAPRAASPNAPFHRDRVSRSGFGSDRPRRRSNAAGTPRPVLRYRELVRESASSLAYRLALRTDFRAVDERARVAFDLALAGNAQRSRRRADQGARSLSLSAADSRRPTIGAEVYPSRGCGRPRGRFWHRCVCRQSIGATTAIALTRLAFGVNAPRGIRDRLRRGHAEGSGREAPRRSSMQRRPPCRSITFRSMPGSRSSTAAAATACRSVLSGSVVLGHTSRRSLRSRSSVGCRSRCRPARSTSTAKVALPQLDARRSRRKKASPDPCKTCSATDSRRRSIS